MGNILRDLYQKFNPKGPSIAKGTKVIMLNTYPGREGVIKKEIIDGIYEIDTPFGISIVTGPQSFTALEN